MSQYKSRGRKREKPHEIANHEWSRETEKKREGKKGRRGRPGKKKRIFFPTLVKESPETKASPDTKKKRGEKEKTPRSRKRRESDRTYKRKTRRRINCHKGGKGSGRFFFLERGKRRNNGPHAFQKYLEKPVWWEGEGKKWGGGGSAL